MFLEPLKKLIRPNKLTFTDTSELPNYYINHKSASAFLTLVSKAGWRPCGPGTWVVYSERWKCCKKKTAMILDTVMILCGLNPNLIVFCFFVWRGIDLLSSCQFIHRNIYQMCTAWLHFFCRFFYLLFWKFPPITARFILASFVFRMRFWCLLTYRFFLNVLYQIVVNLVFHIKFDSLLLFFLIFPFKIHRWYMIV